jgi:eukaryotic-like serine/threonine-protein kinase
LDSDNRPTPSLTGGTVGSGPAVKLAGRYRLESLIARGTVTDLWRAEDEVLGRTVAAKILRPELLSDGTIKRRFRVAAMAAARLSHAHIVSVFDTGEHEGAPFIVMEHLAGGTLRDQLAAGPLDVKGVAPLGAEVAAALNHAHLAGVVHHDIRPENILFTETGHLKISDFGLARAVWATRQSRPEDTPAGGWYLSPELAAGQQADGRADLYALGVVLYECVTGLGPGRPAVSASGETGPSHIRRPSEIRPEVPPELEAVIMKALARAPEDRYASAHVMEKALRKARGYLGPAHARAGSAPAGTASGSGRAAAVQSSAGPALSASRQRKRTRPRLEPASQSFLRAEGRWLLPTILVIVAAVAVVLAIPSLRNRVTNVVEDSLDQGQTPTLQVVNAQAYDPPPGDGEENDDQVRRAFDNNPSTSWSTSSYDSAPLGGLKKGVGIVLDLGAARDLEEIRVQSVSGGWQGVIRSSDDGRSFSDAGESKTAQEEEVFEVSGSHRYWMLWITRLTITPGAGNSNHPYAVAISEITPSGNS